MKQARKNLMAIAGCALAIALNGTNQAQAADASGLAGLRDLRCESLSSPMGIDTATPRLSWKLDDPRRGAQQTAYRILAASSPDKLAQDQGDLWDSGKVVSDQSHLVEYGGKPLDSRQISHWKVKVWDLDGKESPWSEPARFEMGLLKPGDWQARRLDLEPPVVNNEETERWMDFVLIREQQIKDEKIEKARLEMRKYGGAMVTGKDFTLDRVPRTARLYAGSQGYHVIYLNGKRVGDAEFDPANSHWLDRTKDYAVHDVTSLLREGENRIRCLVWAGGARKEVLWLQFILQLDVVDEDGQRRTELATDDSWRQTQSPSSSIIRVMVSEFMMPGFPTC